MPIHANRFADSRESPDSRESFLGSRAEPLFGESRSGGLKIALRRFARITSNVMKIDLFAAYRFARIAPIRVANRRAI